MESLQVSSVAIIIINWNGFPFTLQCIRSLENTLYPSFKIIVIDNGSTDNSLQKLREAYPAHHYIGLAENIGFTGGNNVGMAYALENGFDNILLLNNDTEVSPDFLDQLILFQKLQPNAGLIQPLIFFNQQRKIIWSAGGKYNSLLAIPTTLHDRKTIDPQLIPDRELDWATGCCLLISKEVLQDVGFMVPGYFAYFEDVDWSLRMKKKGYQIFLASKAIIFHEAGASSKKTHSEGTLSATVFYLHARNQIFLIRNHGLFPFALLAFGYQLLKYMVWISYFCLRKRFKKAKAVLRGIKDGFQLNPESNTPLCP
ncbi:MULTISPECIES: glycosyltransferase family 2 protein [Rhodonellum]|nr:MULTISPECIES: glycosyltransferase family 2 protein [Rhodonellum]SDY63184.1 hypothetical protein SAMN05444412_10239 [Rhodonellum ikkaensis]